MRWLAAYLALAAPAMAHGSVECENPQVQVEINYCAQEAWREADAELNTVYQRALAEAVARDQAAQASGSLTPKIAERSLRAAQRDWIAFRDSACAVEAQLAQGGTMMGMLTGNCLEKLTLRRTNDLHFLLDWGN